MEKKKIIEQDFIIDRLKNSILNIISGDSFQTANFFAYKIRFKECNKEYWLGF